MYYVRVMCVRVTCVSDVCNDVCEGDVCEGDVCEGDGVRVTCEGVMVSTEEEISITYSYWDGSGHRRHVKV